MMGERETIRLLRAIRDLSMLGYPYETGSPPIADTLLFALGQIGGIASKAISEHEPRIERAPTT